MSTSTLYALCVLVWGTTWFAITAQLAVLAPEAGVALRFCLSSAILLAFCLARGIPLRHGPRQHALFALQGAAGFCASYIGIYHAERHVVSGVVAVGYAASPLVGLVLARLFLQTPMSRRVAAGGLVGVAGVALIFAHEFERLGATREVALGAALTAGSVLLSGVSTIAAARYQRTGVRGWAPLAWAMGYGGGAAALVSLALGRSWAWAWTPAFLGSLAYLTLVGSVVSFGAYYTVVHRLGPAKAGYIGVVSPVVALGMSSLLEGFVWTASTAGGVTLAIAGNVLAMWRPQGDRAAVVTTEPDPSGAASDIGGEAQLSESSTNTGA
jgi:drug/metabolite transporter (DMT)-like permease